MNKTIHAVLDNYHEGIFPVIAICKTRESAEKFVDEKITADKRKGNNFDYDIIEIEVEEGVLSDSNGDTQKMF